MTWAIKHTPRGGPMIADYECPVHGRFEAVVARDENGDPPTEIVCAEKSACSDGACDLPSPWRISAPAIHTQFVVSATQGKPDTKPHPNAMDTRPLAEGRKNEWRKNRKKQREERRHQRLKEYLR